VHPLRVARIAEKYVQIARGGSTALVPIRSLTQGSQRVCICGVQQLRGVIVSH
jgi:hypothetical protein